MTRISFEIFPPKSELGEATLWRALAELVPLEPAFVSVTYGAGGSTRGHTGELAARIQRETGRPAAAHLTCVGASRAEVDELAERWWELGIRRIVALRGDPPEGAERYRPHPEGYANAAELVAGLRRLHPFDISVGAYPESHPDSASPEADLDNLKRKIDAGAERAITQYFFEPELFCRFRDRAVKAGIAAPIVPGILPVTNFARVKEFSRACGASVPDWMAERFEGLDQDPKARDLVAASSAGELCFALLAEGVRDFHFYTLNRAEPTGSLCRCLATIAGRADPGPGIPESRVLSLAGDSR